MDTKIIFRDHLIRAKLFEQDGENIFVVPPKPRKRNRPGTYCENPAQLLDELVFILSTYCANQFKAKGNFKEKFKLEMEYISAVATIGGMRELFIKSVAKEKSFDDVYKKLKRWGKNWVDYRQGKLSTPKWEYLKAILFYNLKVITNFTEREIFIYLARLLKYFGFAAGNEDRIVNRLRFEYYSKGKDLLNGLMKLINDPASING